MVRNVLPYSSFFVTNLEADDLDNSDDEDTDE